MSEENPKISVSFRIERKLYENFKDRCKADRQTATQVLETLIFDYLQFPNKDKENILNQLRQEFLGIAKESNKVILENLSVYTERIKFLEKELMMKQGEVEVLRRMLRPLPEEENLNATRKRLTRVKPNKE